MIPRVVDVSRYETLDPNGMQKAKDDGIWGVIAKSTQGTSYRDKTFPMWIEAAKKAGLEVGAYHFADGSDPEDQVDHFVNSVNPTPDMLMALDYENYKSQMTPANMVKFLHAIEDRLQRKAVIYSGNLLKETIGSLSKGDQAYVCSHKLWLAHYNAKPTLPKGFSKIWLHQFTGDGVGPTPHWIGGIKAPGNKGLDLNAYDGTIEQLRSEWGTRVIVPVPAQVPAEHDPDLLEWIENLIKNWKPPFLS